MILPHLYASKQYNDVIKNNKCLLFPFWFPFPCFSKKRYCHVLSLCTCTVGSEIKPQLNFPNLLIISKLI